MGIRSRAVQYAPNAVVHMRNLRGPVHLFTDFRNESPVYWQSKLTKEGLRGNFPGWGITLNEAQVTHPARLISVAEAGRALALLPNRFIWRGTFHHTTMDLGLAGGPTHGDKFHGRTTAVLYCDGHVKLLKWEAQGGQLGEPRAWNNSPFDDGGGWNRNRSGDPGDDVYHGDGGAGDAAYPRLAGSYPGWIPVTDQLWGEDSLWGVHPIDNGWMGLYGNGGDNGETIFDIDMTYGEYNTSERPDAKYDE